MADIELVIKISEEMYKWVNDVNKFFADYGLSDFIDLVENGTPLPKGHGRLIDGDRFDVITLQGKSDEFIDGVMWVLQQIDNAPTILEASESEVSDE